MLLLVTSVITASAQMVSIPSAEKAADVLKTEAANYKVKMNESEYNAALEEYVHMSRGLKKELLYNSTSGAYYPAWVKHDFTEAEKKVITDRYYNAKYTYERYENLYNAASSASKELIKRIAYARLHGTAVSMNGINK